MKSYPHIISKLFYEPLVITRAKHAAICRVLESRLSSNVSEPSDQGDQEPDEGLAYSQIEGTAIVPVYGILGKHLDWMEMESGGCDLDSVSRMLDIAEEDNSVQRILFDFRSPGGTVTGIPELARRIAACQKDTIGYTDSECCSGALWLAMQCRRFYCAESASVGSIGVWCAYEDWSRKLQNDGVNVEEFSAGKYKTMGAYWRPLTKEEGAMIQASVDKIYAQFKAAVNRFREIPESYMQGQIFDGEQAAQIGLVDGLFDSLDDLISDS